MKYAPFKFFLERILTLIIKGKIGIKIDEIHLYNTFEHIWFKLAFCPKRL
jgi:hypothetical protein